MQSLDLANFVSAVSDIGKASLLVILIRKRLFRTFPLFFAYILWDLMSDLLIFSALITRNDYVIHHYVQVYYSANIFLYLLEIGILLEVASNVLHPAKKAVSRGTLYLLLGAMLTIGIICFFFAARVNAAPFFNLRVYLLINTTAAILCVLIFLLIAGFSQVLGLGWKNHVLQLATGLAFFSAVQLLMELMQSQLQAGPSYLEQYRMWGQIEVIGYLCTLSFWCYAFLKKEAPRKEFSPQMAKILVSLSSGAKRQHAVLARSRDD